MAITRELRSISGCTRHADLTNHSTSFNKHSSSRSCLGPLGVLSVFHFCTVSLACGPPQTQRVMEGSEAGPASLVRSGIDSTSHGACLRCLELGVTIRCFRQETFRASPGSLKLDTPDVGYYADLALVLCNSLQNGLET